MACKKLALEQITRAAKYLPERCAVRKLEADGGWGSGSGDLDRVLIGMALIDLVTFVAESAIIFGGIVPFIPQYLIVRNTGSCHGFSTFVCLILLAANILRILVWFVPVRHSSQLPFIA